MKRMGVREVKDHWCKVLAQVELEGEIIEVTRHGQTIARLVPIVAVERVDRDKNGTWTELNRLAEQLRSRVPISRTARDVMDDVRG